MRWIAVGEKRDAGVVHQAALGQVHDVGGNILGRKVQDEFCQCGFGLSHGDSPFLDFGYNNHAKCGGATSIV